MTERKPIGMSFETWVDRLTYIPPSLALRKEVEEIDDLAATKTSESAVRQLVEDLNSRIVAAIRTGISGPRIAVVPLNPDKVVAEWRRRG